MFKCIMLGLLFATVTFSAVRKEVINVIKADTVITTKIDTIKTITFDTLKVEKIFNDTSIVVKIDTVIIKQKKKK